MSFYYVTDGRIVGERGQPDLPKEVGLFFLIRRLRANSAHCGESCTPVTETRRGAVLRLLRRSREIRRRRGPWPGWLSPVVRAAWLREPLDRTRSSAVRSGRSRPSFVTNLARLAIAIAIAVGRRPTVQIPLLSKSRGPHTLAETVAELGRRARAATPEEAARAGDRVVVSIPPAPYRELSRRRTVRQGRARHRSVRDAPHDEADDGRAGLVGQVTSSAITSNTRSAALGSGPRPA